MVLDGDLENATFQGYCDDYPAICDALDGGLRHGNRQAIAF